MLWPVFICDLCAYILIWTFSMRLYRALHIVCQHIMCIALHFARQAAFVRGDPTSLSFSLLACSRPGSWGYFTHSMCLQFFYLQDQISQVCITSLCGTWAKVAYLYFYYSLCGLHVYECNQLYQIYLSVSIKSSI